MAGQGPAKGGGLRFACLGSGSRGNALVVESGTTRLLVDCGFSASETRRRLGRLGLAPDDLTGVLVTHEHGDHIRGVAALARRHGLRVWATHGTARALEAEDLAMTRIAVDTPFAVDGLQVQPFPVPHDAREPCQFVFSDGHRRLGMLTDTGAVTPHIRRRLADCQALVLECNHDPDMLASGPYPDALKARVGGRFGHLSNAQAGELLAAVAGPRLTHVVAAHLSEKNNTPALARAALGAALGCSSEWIAVAEQDRVLAWRSLAAN